MKKRLLSALCAVMLLICAVPMASAQTGDAARRADALTVLHLLSEDPSRDLTKPATRAQAAVLLVRRREKAGHRRLVCRFPGCAGLGPHRCELRQPPGLDLRRQQRTV